MNDMKQISFMKPNKKGQSLVEFALVMPILLSLILGMLEFGWIFNGKITLTSAAREGARTAIVYETAAAASTPVQSAVEKSSGVSSLTSISAITTFETNKAKVVVTAQIKPLVGLFVQDTVDLSAAAVMRLE